MRDQKQQMNSDRRAWTSGVEMTSMVDVTFLLLIFFMVTASFSLQKVIAVPQPETQTPSQNSVEPSPEQTIQLWVDSAGGFHVQTDADRQTVLGKQALVRCLKRHLQPTGSATNSPVEIHVLVEDEARLRWLVDAIDAGAIAGSTSITIRQVQSSDAMDFS